MRFNLAVAAVISALFNSVLGKYVCTTRFAPTKVSKVMTYYTTSTKFIVTSSYTYGTQYNPSSTPISYTFVSVTGKTTKTIPTGSKFTPIYKAPLGPAPPFAAEKRDPSPAPAATTTSYPSAVVCSTSVTAGTYTQIGTATAYYTARYTVKTFHQTTSVATYTSYDACKPSNIITATKGQPINSFWMEYSTDICDVNNEAYAGVRYCNDASTCCNYAQANGRDGFVWLNFTGPAVHCYLFVDNWGFQTGETTDQPYYVGNGASGSGYYGPAS